MHSVSQLVTEEFNMPVDTFQVILEMIFPVNHMIDAKKFHIHRCGGLLFCCIVENNTLSLFRSHFWREYSFIKLEIDQQTKFWQNLSIHGWDITTSVFWKQMSTLLEFYFRFCPSSSRHHQHVLLCPPNKFNCNATIHGGIITSYTLLKTTFTWPL